MEHKFFLFTTAVSKNHEGMWSLELFLAWAMQGYILLCVGGGVCELPGIYKPRYPSYVTSSSAQRSRLHCNRNFKYELFLITYVLGFQDGEAPSHT
jgi:hypothetical protein